MNTGNNRMHSQRGSAMVVVMTVLCSVWIAVEAIQYTSMSRGVTTEKVNSIMRAQIIAEAGVNRAYSILATNFAQRYNAAAFPPTVYGVGSWTGTYNILVTPVGDDMATISATGYCGTAKLDVLVDVKDYGGTVFTWPSTLTNYAFLAGGTFNFNGSGEVSGQDNAVIHANQAVTIQGDAGPGVTISSSVSVSSQGSGGVDGDVISPDNSGIDASDVTGTITTEAVPAVEIPQIDLTPWYNQALANGLVRTNWSFNSGTYTPPGGVIWVVGDFNMSGGTINGSVVATGDIHLSGWSMINAGPSGVAMASRDGGIQMQGGFNGLAYAPNGDYKQTSNDDVAGQVIAGGNIDKAGNSSALLFSGLIPDPPGEDTGAGVIGVSAWQK